MGNPYPFEFFMYPKLYPAVYTGDAAEKFFAGLFAQLRAMERRKLLAYSSVEIRHKSTKVKSRLRSPSRQCRGMSLAYANRTVSKGDL